MASSSLCHLSQKLSVVFKREVCPDRAQIFAFQFSSDFGIGATPTIQEMYVFCCLRDCFSFPSWHQSQEQTSSWHHAWVLKLQNQDCKEASTNLSLCWLKQPERKSSTFLLHPYWGERAQNWNYSISASTPKSTNEDVCFREDLDT